MCFVRKDFGSPLGFLKGIDSVPLAVAYCSFRLGKRRGEGSSGLMRCRSDCHVPILVEPITLPRDLSMAVKMIRTLLALALAAAVIGVGTSPASARTSDTSERNAVSPAPSVTLYVRNNNWMDVNVYAFSGGKRRRLGMVAGNSSGKFVIPGWIIEGSRDLRLIADPIGSRRGVATHPVLVRPGDIIEYRVEYNLGLSSVMVIPGS